jgi:two-component sensor histidine kinase
LKEGSVKDEQILLKKRDGTFFIGSVSAVAVEDDEGNIKYYDGIIEDITERKRIEERIKKDLKDKEVLLKEIHHRVKNNLQVISSLLNLQAQNLDDEKTLAIFKESKDRIRSMALVHENLYKSPDLGIIDFAEYVKSLANGLFRSYTADPNKIVLHLKIADVALSVDVAAPCGLIINELISNALKYAFPPSLKRKAKIEIALTIKKDNNIELVVKDNGVGIPENVDMGTVDSLGLFLVNILVKDQLGGSLEIVREEGTAFHIRFKK